MVRYEKTEPTLPARAGVTAEGEGQKRKKAEKRRRGETHRNRQKVIVTYGGILCA